MLCLEEKLQLFYTTCSKDNVSLKNGMWEFRFPRKAISFAAQLHTPVQSHIASFARFLLNTIAITKKNQESKAHDVHQTDTMQQLYTAMNTQF